MCSKTPAFPTKENCVERTFHPNQPVHSVPPHSSLSLLPPYRKQKKSPRPLKESNDPQQHHQILLMASGPILTSGRSLGAWRRLQCPSCVTPRTIPGRRKTNSRGRRKSACLLSERRRHHCVFIWLVGVVLRSVLHSSRCFWESGSLSLVRAYGLDNVLGGRRSYRLRST